MGAGKVWGGQGATCQGARTRHRGQANNGQREKDRKKNCLKP